MGCWTPPFGNPQVSLRYPDWPNSSPLARLELRCRWGKRERIRARHGRRTSTASGWGLAPPGPPRFPKGKSSPVMRACWGLRPLTPLRSPLGNVCRSCASAHGTTSVAAFAAKPSQICAEAPAAKRLGVPSLPDFIASFGARLWRSHSSATAVGGIPKGAQPSLASLCLLSAGQKVGARRGLSASKGKDKIIKKRKEDQKTSPLPRRREKLKF